MYELERILGLTSLIFLCCVRVDVLCGLIGRTSGTT
jgi:hypothetical protein